MSCRRPIRCALLVATALLVAGCQREGPAAVVPGGVFRVAAAEPASLDPLFASQPAATFLDQLLFDGLVRYDDATAAVVPDMARSWEISPDNTRFTFHLRGGARFSNGERVTAASFVRGMTRALSPALHAAPGSLSYQLDGIMGADALRAGVTTTLSGAEVVDDRTLVIRLAAPDAEFLVRCASLALTPLPSEAAMAAQRPSWAEAPIGNGPFKLASDTGQSPAASPAAGNGSAAIGWVHNRSIALVPNPLHGGGTAHVGRVDVKIFASVEAAYAAWRAGQLDWSGFPASATAEVLRLSKDLFLNRPMAGVDYLTVTGTTLPATAHSAVQLRQAVSMSIDRVAIAKRIFGEAADPATGFVAPLIPGSASGDGATPCAGCKFDPALARRLLASSGVALSGVFGLSYPAGMGMDAWMEAVALDLSLNLGIHAEALPTPGVSAGGGAGPGLLALGALGVSRQMRAPLPDDLMQQVLGTGGRENLSGYANPAMDALVARARSIGDPAARAAVYQQAERLALQDLPIVPLFWERGVRLVRLKDWANLGMDAFGNPTLRSAVYRR